MLFAKHDGHMTHLLVGGKCEEDLVRNKGGGWVRPILIVIFSVSKFSPLLTAGNGLGDSVTLYSVLTSHLGKEDPSGVVRIGAHMHTHTTKFINTQCMTISKTP